MEDVMDGPEDTLRLIATNDERFIQWALKVRPESLVASALDTKTFAMVRLGALLALEASVASYQSTVDTALTAGATAEEIVACLIAVGPVIGEARLVLTGSHLACAMGYDLDGIPEAQ
jgi:4-carboxymuconolactone decarboxylase